MLTYTSVSLPTETDIIAAVWVLLARHPERRPPTEDVADLLGYRARHLRTALHAAHRQPLRSLIPIACGLHAVWLVHSKGEKAIAAVLESGHRSSWALNKQLKKHCRVTLQNCRNRLPGAFDWDGLHAAYVHLAARTSGSEPPQKAALSA